MDHQETDIVQLTAEVSEACAGLMAELMKASRTGTSTTAVMRGRRDEQWRFVMRKVVALDAKITGCDALRSALNTQKVGP